MPFFYHIAMVNIRHAGYNNLIIMLRACTEKGIIHLFVLLSFFLKAVHAILVHLGLKTNKQVYKENCNFYHQLYIKISLGWDEKWASESLMWMSLARTMHEEGKCVPAANKIKVHKRNKCCISHLQADV